MSQGRNLRSAGFCSLLLELLPRAFFPLLGHGVYDVGYWVDLTRWGQAGALASARDGLCPKGWHLPGVIGSGQGVCRECWFGTSQILSNVFCAIIRVEDVSAQRLGQH